MKNWIYLIPLLLCFPAWLASQSGNDGLTVGIQAEGLFFDAGLADTEVRVGQQLGIWAQYPIGKQRAIELSVGYRRLHGYQLQYSQYQVQMFPTSYQEFTTVSQLSGLEHCALGLAWEQQLGRKSPWSISVGGQVALLSRVRGQRQTNLFYNTWETRFGENFSGSAASIQSVNTISDESLTTRDFNRLDAGVQVALLCAITPGLQVRLGLYQGLQPLFRAGLFTTNDSHYLTAVSLGIKARLF